MFNGIIETTGSIISKVVEAGSTRFTIQPAEGMHDLQLGESIAINGVCLTVTDFTTSQFCVTAVPETLRRSNIGLLSKHNNINLERALLPNQRISGHYVQGHVDATGVVSDIKIDGDAWLLTINVPQALTRYMINKGYIALDGMSVTLIDVGQDWFTVTLIPITRELTISKHYQLGSVVNLEVDMMAKYIEKLARKI